MGITGITTASGVLSSRGILRALILLSLSIFAPILASAATYYTAPSGSNSNPGTQAAPFATLKKAHDVAVAGDTIFMRGGTYNLAVGGQNKLTKSGGSGNRIKVFNYPGEVPILDGSSATDKALVPIYMQGASWWHIKGLEIKSGPHCGIYMVGASSNNIVEQNNIHHNGRLHTVGSGIGHWGSGSNNLFLNNDLHHNRDTTNGNADGLSLVTTGTGNVVRGNRVWRNSDDGIDLWNSVPVTVENNWVWEQGYNDALQPTGGNGNGFKLGGSAAGDGGHMIKNNLSWRNLSRGFDDNGANVAMFVYNNTAYENGRPDFRFGEAVANVLKNNVAFGQKGVSLNGSVKQSFNSWNLPVTVNNSDFASLNFSCAGGPRQASGSLPNCSFLKLAAGSDLINKGTNVGIPYTGSAPDLGAFEYGGTSAPPPPSGGTPPTVSITAPANGATVSGTAVTVSATASDNVGVAGVHFELDGANLGAEDTTAPYSVPWNSTTATNGSHTLTAVARDAANSTTSADVSVTVNNAGASSCTQIPLNVSAASSDGGFAYKVNGSLGTPADNSANTTRSVLKLFENGLELGPAHSTHANIRNLGQGRLSHWSQTTGTGESLRFAASNNTDPRTNGRSYRYCVPATASATTALATSPQRASATAALASTTAPTVNFSASPTSGTASLAVTFTNSSSGNVTSYSWNFGDGSTSTEQNPVHTYATSGIYSVILTATGPGGTNTETGSITVLSRPVAAYNFEEASGSKVIDASSQGNHGTRSGNSRITQGRFGKALSFDGLNDWVTVNDAASLDLTTGMTVEAWVYPTESMTGWRTLLTKESPPDRASYYLHANSDTDQPATGLFIDDYQDVRGGPWLLPDTWVHLAGTYDGTTQRLYVNGTEVANRAQSRPIEVSGGVLRIGGNSILGEIFKGRIDEIRVYNRALSAAEITTDMNTSVATSSPPVFLVGDKNVTPVTDSISQGKAQAFQTQAAVTGWVTGLSVYVDTGSTGTTLVAGLYTDENGHPGTLLAQGILSSPGSVGWEMVSLPPVSITAGSNYWIAILSRSGMLTFRDSGTWVGELSETSSQSTLSELPSTWTTGTYEFEGPLSAYGAGYQ